MFTMLRHFAFSFLILLFLSACGGSSSGDDTTNSVDKIATISPTSNNSGWWQERHDEIVSRDKSNIELVFIGDSITHQWEEEAYGLPIWSSYFDEETTLNLGFDSDKTQHVLWRIDHGELDNMAPEFVVLMIGTNNTHSDTAADIALGIQAIVDRILEKLPSTTIILHRIFPRGDADNPSRIPLDEASEIVRQSVNDERVKFVDINSHFEDANGDVPIDIMYDHVHLTTKGYQIWADALMSEFK
jgi:lysophospholipase L1-like esterase